MAATDDTSPSGRILSLDRLAERIRKYQAAGRTVVHCHGVFDPLHVGHIRHFKEARRFGDVLVVTVTPDRFVNKGPHRPVFSEELRAEAIAALSAVDHVAVNEWPTAVETIERLRPNVFVKGGEFRSGQDLTGAIAVEEAAIRSVGGVMQFTDDLVFSASHLVNRHLSVFPPAVVDFLERFAGRYPAADAIRCLQSARPLKILVVGETIIDEYQYVEAIGKSSKEPTLVVKSLNSDRFVGGAAAVANHIADFCGHVTLKSLLGVQPSHEELIRQSLKPTVTADFLFRPDAPTIVKRRFVEQYFFSKLFEVYEINDSLPSVDQSAAWAASLRGKLDQYDLVIASDFGHGMFTDEVVEVLCRESRFLALNTQSNAGNLGFNLISRYARADYIALAEAELRLEYRDRRGDLRPMLKDLSGRLNCQRVVVTRGNRGSLAYSPDEGFVEVPAFATRVVDRIGAGNAFLAITALCAVQQVPLELLSFIGNVAGSEAVASVGGRDPIQQIALCRHIEHLLK